MNISKNVFLNGSNCERSLVNGYKSKININFSRSVNGGFIAFKRTNRIDTHLDTTTNTGTLFKNFFHEQLPTVLLAVWIPQHALMSYF